MASTPEIRLWSIKEQNRQDIDKVRPLLPETIYRLVIAKACPFMAVEVEITVPRYQAPSSGFQSLLTQGQ